MTEEDLLPNVAAEPGAEYVFGNRDAAVTYINPFQDRFFKKIFASETSKEVLRSFLNGVLEGKRSVETLAYGKNEYPGEIDAEGAAVFDVVCTDTNGVTFLVEIQQERQEYFKERSVFYASRLISDQAPRGDAKWMYDLPDVYVVCLLVKFDLPGTSTDSYCRHIGFCDLETGVQFYDKLEFIYLEIKKFNKEIEELHTPLDEWLYALKNAHAMNAAPDFFKTPGLDYFFELAKFLI